MEEVDGGEGERLRGEHVGGVAVDYPVVAAVPDAGDAAHAYARCGHDAADVAEVGAAGAVALHLDLFGPDEADGVSLQHVVEGLVLDVRHVSWVVVDDALGAHRHSPSLEGAVHLPVRVLDGFHGLASDVALKADVAGDVVDYLSALGDDGVDADSVLVLHPLAFAAWVGFLVTFVNLIPSWQLDGGHVIRALFGRETHKIISITGIFLLMLSGYVIMAVIIAFFLMREGTESMAPLDDISPTSLQTKLGLIGYAILMGLSLIVLLQA